MKVYVIGPIYPLRGGIAHSNALLCENLSKTHCVKVLSFKRLFPSFLYPGKQQKEISEKVIELDVDQIIDSINPLTWVKAFSLIREGNPDLLAIQWWSPFFAPPLFVISLLTKLFTKTKISIICQNVLPHEGRVVDKFLTKLVFRNADFFVVLSTEDRNNLKSLIPNAQVEYLVEPSYEKVFKPEKIDKTEARKILGLEAKAILFFGIVRKYKGLTYLLKAMPKVLQAIDADLLIVGEFWESKKKYLDDIRKLGIAERVIVVDRYVSDEEAVLYFSAADVVVLPYISSVASGVVQLAYGLNVPVITTNIQGNTDSIENDKTGLVVPPKDSDSLANAIISYFQHNKEKEFRQEMQKRAGIFNWDEEKAKSFFHGMNE